MAQGLFVPSGARVPLRGLPPGDRPIRLPDGRVLRLHDAGVADMGGPMPSPWQMWHGPQGLQVLASLDTTEAWGLLLHVSASYRRVTHLPSWDDLRAIKDALFGDVDACMILPKREDYVNIRSNVFHLWQLPQRWGIR